MGQWGSTSAWNHAITYYLKAVLVGVGLAFLVVILADGDSEGAAALVALMAFLGWPLIMTVLLFNETDRQISKRLQQYHDQAHRGQTSTGNARSSGKRRER